MPASAYNVLTHTTCSERNTNHDEVSSNRIRRVVAGPATLRSVRRFCTCAGACPEHQFACSTVACAPHIVSDHCVQARTARPHSYLDHIGRIGEQPIEESSRAAGREVLPALLPRPNDGSQARPTRGRAKGYERERDGVYECGSGLAWPRERSSRELVEAEIERKRRRVAEERGAEPLAQQPSLDLKNHKTRHTHACYLGRCLAARSAS